MKEFEVWSEGYVATCEHNTATFHGKFKGETFKDAVAAFVETLDEYSKSTVNLDKLTFWGCKIFDNETDARKLFG